MRNVGTLNESNVLLLSETCLVLLSPIIIHVLGLGGGVLAGNLRESFMPVSMCMFECIYNIYVECIFSICYIYNIHLLLYVRVNNYYICNI